MNLRYRPICLSDIPECLDLCPARSGAAVLGRTTEAVWRKLIRSPGFTGAILEDVSQPKPRRILGFGGAVFVSRQFFADELASPRPGINDRILAGFANGGYPVLSLNEIARANSTTGLSHVVLYSNWDRALLNSEQTQEMRHQIMLAWTDFHLGYRIREFAIECMDEVDHYNMETAANLPFRRPFEEFPGDPHRYLVAATSEAVRNIESNLANIVFRYKEPVVYYRPAEQRVLSAALDGATDEELAGRLGVSTTAIKKTWASAFARTRERLPDLLPDDGEQTVRGAQKRHRLLAWLRENRQELKPLLYPAKPRRLRTKGASGTG